MISTLILAAALATQASATDTHGEPIRSWVHGTVDGRPTWLWGWKDAGGWVRFHERENPQVFPQYRPTKPANPSGVTLGAGMVLESDGSINSGVNMQATRPTGVIDTNDPDLGSKLAISEDCLDGRCPNDPSEPELPDKPDYTMPLIAVAGAILFLAYMTGRNSD